MKDTNESSSVFGTDDPGADHDVDGVPNWEDTDYWEDVLVRPADCVDTVAPIGKCDSTPVSIAAKPSTPITMKFSITPARSTIRPKTAITAPMTTAR